MRVFAVTVKHSRARANDFGRGEAFINAHQTVPKRRNTPVLEGCGARTRAGTSCRAKRLPGRNRCKWHGGASTGPKTAEGKAKVAKNLLSSVRAREPIVESGA
ncbi:HGGxSTG domain-containing protein [Lysobacter sp. P5_B9]